MGAIAFCNSWLPQDDILLKNSIEAGASLESLAKGAVEFSRKFKLKELEDRWRSLLYDPSVSLEACARMTEFEQSTAQSKSKKVDTSKESKLGTGKRKYQSIRSCYYAMRKRVRDDTLSQGDVSFLMDTAFINEVGDNVVEDPLENRFALGNEFMVGQQYMLKDPMDQNTIINGQIPQEIGIPNMTGKTCPLQDLYSHETFETNSIDAATWKTVENMLLSRTPDDDITGNNVHTMDRFDIIDDNDAGKGILEEADTHLLTNDMSFDEFQPTTGSQDDYFADIANFEFTNEDEMLINDDKSEGVDGTCHGDLETLLLNTLEYIDDEVCNMPENDPTSVAPSCMHSGLIPVNQASTSAPSFGPRFPEYPSDFSCCVLSTEDSEIPCNDDITFPCKKSTNSHRKTQNKATMPSSSGKGMTGTQAIEKANKPQSTQGLEVGLGFAVNGHGVEIETRQRGGLCQKSMTAKKEYPDLPHIAIGQIADLSHLPKVSAPILDEADDEFVSSENEEQFFDSDDDIPLFSDVESMIFGMELGPEDLGDFYATTVAKYSREDVMKRIIRLEQNAHSYKQREMGLHGAFAVLIGENSKHYIKKQEVLLGRATDDFNVDIDLTRIGDANKISRRQVSINLDDKGAFSLKNLGRCLVYVNSKEISPGQLVDLDSNALILIREIPFIFEVYQQRVKLFLKRLSDKSRAAA